MGDFNLLNIDWTLQRPTPTPGNKLMQLLQIITSHNTCKILDLVISTEEQLIVNLKIIDKIGAHQANK